MDFKKKTVLVGLKPLSVYKYALTDSTNTRARELARSTASDAAIIARGQTAGRGRLGRSFVSDSGLGLYMSLLIHPKSTESALTLTALMGVAVCRAIKKLTGLQTSIKWVNDIILNEKKLSGILAEGEFDSQGRLKYSVIGVGVNLIPRDFLELSDIATSLGEYCTPPSAERLAYAIIREFYKIYEKKDHSSALRYYKENSAVIGKEINVIKHGEVLPAVAVGIADDFSLIIETEGGRDIISSCEVSIRKR